MLLYTEIGHLFWGSCLLMLFLSFLPMVVVVTAGPTGGGYEACEREISSGFALFYSHIHLCTRVIFKIVVPSHSERPNITYSQDGNIVRLPLNVNVYCNLSEHPQH